MRYEGRKNSQRASQEYPRSGWDELSVNIDVGTKIRHCSLLCNGIISFIEQLSRPDSKNQDVDENLSRGEGLER